MVRANTTMAQVRACAGGCGLALLPEVVAAAEPGLWRVLPRLAGPSRELWGVSHADLRGNPRVRLFLDWFARRIAEAVGPRG